MSSFNANGTRILDSIQFAKATPAGCAFNDATTKRTGPRSPRNITKASSHQESVQRKRPPEVCDDDREAKRRKATPQFPLHLLSREFSHTKHTDDCFVSHLLDTTRMWRLKCDIKQTLQTTERQFVVQQGLALQCATKALRPLKLDVLRYYFINRNREIFESGGSTRDMAYEEGLELKSRLRLAETACQKSITQLFETAEDLIKEPFDFDRTGHQQTPRMSNGFELVLKLARRCGNQILDKEKQLKQLLKRATNAGAEVGKLVASQKRFLAAEKRRRALQEKYNRLKMYLEVKLDEKRILHSNEATQLDLFLPE